MKIICEDYGCGTSSAFVDYGLKNVVHCSAENHKHIFDIRDEDIFFTGHEFLMYLWDSEWKIKHWQNYPHKKIVWCFEKIDCIVPVWQQKSHYSLNICQKFTDRFFVSDEQDARKYGIKWLPQWASRKFYDQRNQIPTEDRIVFSGQAGFLGYDKRDKLLSQLMSDDDFYISNTNRKLGWDEYVSNFLNHSRILAPFGNLKAFNTRTFEAITSGRLLFQQVDSEYKWHMEQFGRYDNIKFFETYEDLLRLLRKDEIRNYKVQDVTASTFEENSVYNRFKKIGLEIE